MAPSTTLRPLSSLKVSSHLIPAHGGFPNSSITSQPLRVYHGAFDPPVSASAIEKHLSQVNVVQPAWRYTMYRQHHYHSTTHEVLCISRGSAKLCFGGPDNEQRVEVVANHGDVIVVPSGVAHALLEEQGTQGFEMVGSYPVGSDQWDMCVGEAGEKSKWKTIEKLEWFSRDPIYGDEGPALDGA